MEEPRTLVRVGVCRRTSTRTYEARKELADGSFCHVNIRIAEGESAEEFLRSTVDLFYETTPEIGGTYVQ